MLGIRLGLTNRNKSIKESNASVFVKRFTERGIADGCIVESTNCLLSVPFIKENNWKFYYRGIDDGCTVESLECVKF
tara:strand:- start:2123 stop:2353 length:231 start_codon:yes stop_codon:yes gene_type:complete